LSILVNPIKLINKLKIGTMKNFYQRLPLLSFVILMAIIPFISMAQQKATETTTRQNVAPSYDYWSIGVFGGPMQFNGDLGRNHWVNVYSNSLGYNVGLVAAKQFNRVIGVRARFAYGMVQGNVENKFCWEYKDGDGIREYITQSFKSTILESDLQLTLNWLNLVQDYKPERVVSSYIIAGIGLDQSKGTKWDANNNEIAYLGKKDNVMNVGNNKGMGGSDLRAKAVAGLGFDFNINKQISIPLEFAWRWQNSDDLDMELGGAMKVVGDMYSSATIGLNYKFGYKGGKPEKMEAIPETVAVLVPEPEVSFTVIAPSNLPVERRIREIFPVRNYVFFDLGSTEIPDRYVLLKKDQVKDFREDQLETFTPKRLSGRSDRQMIVYYNVLNILGDRMVKNPSATITLVGSSEKGAKDGQLMAESIKLYLVNIFGIDAKRITIQGQTKPDVPSEQPGGTQDLVLLREGDRRVSIESSSPVLLMEFQSGPNAPLKPVEITTKQEAPVESYITFKVEAEKDALTSWSFTVTDDKGIVQSYGPYTDYNMSVPSKSILGDRPEGDYKVVMTGQTKNGRTIKKETTAHMVLWTPSKNEEGMRFSVIYEFNESKAITIYEKYLTEVVTPKIPVNGTVIIHGYTDVIGDAPHNLELSLARANDVKTILEKSLANAHRSDVKFEIYGSGEDEKLSPFDNKYPEERFYNRSVVIDIIPQK
jgi:outer membrane protein OmpA-like peptidoglycan-associated protein